MRMGKWAARRRQLRDEGVRARQRSGRGAAARRLERRQMMAGLHGLVAEAVQGVAGELAKAVEEARGLQQQLRSTASAAVERLLMERSCGGRR